MTAETMAHGYQSDSTQLGLSNEYQHDKSLDGFQKSLGPCAWMKVTLVLEGLKYFIHS